MNLNFWPFNRRDSEAAKLPVEKPSAKARTYKAWDREAMVHVPTGKAADPVNVFTMPTVPPGVLPSKEVKMAVDSCIGQASAGNQGLYGWAQALNSIYAEGQAFIGYAQAAALLQRSEYRVPVETIASEMTRNWGMVTYTGEDDADQKAKKTAGQKKKDVEDQLKAWKAQAIVRKTLELGEGFGRGQLFIDTGKYDPGELKMPLPLESTKIGKGSIVNLQVIEPIWTYPGLYNSNNPLKPDYYKPQTWYVMGTEVHHTRLLTIVPHPVSDILKPAYAFGGLSMTQMMIPYVDNWLQTRQSVNDIIQNFSTSVLATNMETLTQSDELVRRAALFVANRTNQGLFLLDKDAEEFSNVSTPLSSLDKLQAQAQEHMAAPSRIPLVKLFGITPAGLNASSEGELQAFNESLSSDQEAHASPVMEALIKLAQLNLWGAIDENIGWKWNPIKHLDKVEEATADKMKAEADSIRINDGIIDPSEVREVLANDETSPYHGIDPNDVPEPPEPELGPGQGTFEQQEKQ